MPDPTQSKPDAPASPLGTPSAKGQTEGPCPHARPSWTMCPHCLGVNRPTVADPIPTACGPYGDTCTEEEVDTGGVLRHYCDQVLIAGATRYGPVDLNDFTMDGRPGWDCPHGVRADEFCRRCATCRIPGCGHVAVSDGICAESHPIPTDEEVTAVLGDGWKNAWPTGMDLVTSWEARPYRHERLKTCDGCGESVTREGITNLAYYYQVCECDAAEWPHILERVCHLRCMARRSPDLAAQALLNTASYILRNYKRGEATADKIDTFLAAHNGGDAGARDATSASVGRASQAIPTPSEGPET